jgi:predicted nucleic acid-binding protein
VKAARRLEIFVDTSAWLAVSDGRDKYHAAARAGYLHLIREQHLLVTTNLVIAETYILIRRTGGHAPAQRFLSSLHGSPRLLKVYSAASLEAQAEAILASYADQDFSYTDAVSFAVMQVRSIAQALTFDRHFATLGFHMLPGLH